MRLRAELKLYTYNAAGIITYYTWDVLNRNTVIDYGDVKFDLSYDQGTHGIGHLSQITTTPKGSSANTTLAWDYDPLDRVQARHQSVVLSGGSVTLNTSYAWNPSSASLGSITLPSGHTIGYVYDATGLLTGINLDGQPLIANIGYTAFDTLASWSIGVKQYTISYDLNGRPTTLPLGDAQRALTWDNASRLTQIQDSPLIGSVLTRHFSYDRLDRVLSQDVDPTTTPAATAQHYSYTWDLAGNRSTYSYNNGSSTWSYAYTTATSSNQLNQIAGSGAAAGSTLNYSYDAAGNPKSDTTNAYTWANNGTLASLTHGTQTTQYLYNGLNQRVAKVGQDTRLFTYDEAGHLIGEYTATGQAIQEHIWLGNIPMAVISTTGNAPSTAVSSSANAIAIDNTDSAFAKTAGWVSATAINGYYGKDYLSHPAGNTGESVTWKINVPANGDYRLYARWAADPGNSTWVNYTIIGGNGTGDATSTATKISNSPQNQRINGSQWVLLGTYHFDKAPVAGTPMAVTIRDRTDGTVVADALHLEPATSSGTPTITQVSYVFTNQINTPRVITDASGKVLWK